MEQKLAGYREHEQELLQQLAGLGDCLDDWEDAHVPQRCVSNASRVSAFCAAHVASGGTGTGTTIGVAIVAGVGTGGGALGTPEASSRCSSVSTPSVRPNLPTIRANLPDNQRTVVCTRAILASSFLFAAPFFSQPHSV